MRLLVLVCVVISSSPALAKSKKAPPPPSPATATASKTDPAAATRAFEKLKSLEGKWTASYEGKQPEALFDVVAGKSAVLQKSGFVIAYYLEGGALVGIAFTDDGNQPRIRSVGLSDDGKSISFDVTDITNLKPGSGHMTGMTLRFTDEDHLVQTFRWKQGGKESTFDVTMARNSASTLK